VHDEADFKLDLRDAFSPLSLLKVSRIFTEMAPHQTVDIWGCDADTRRDLLKVLPQGSFEVLATEGGGDREPGRVRLKKRG